MSTNTGLLLICFLISILVNSIIVIIVDDGLCFLLLFISFVFIIDSHTQYYQDDLVFNQHI